jgi:hypothetical protein
LTHTLNPSTQAEEKYNMAPKLNPPTQAEEKYNMAPKLNPSTQAEEKYNMAHAKTSVVIECAFGVCK